MHAHWERIGGHRGRGLENSQRWRGWSRRFGRAHAIVSGRSVKESVQWMDDGSWSRQTPRTMPVGKTMPKEKIWMSIWIHRILSCEDFSVRPFGIVLRVGRNILEVLQIPPYLPVYHPYGVRVQRPGRRGRAAQRP